MIAENSELSQCIAISIAIAIAISIVIPISGSNADARSISSYFVLCRIMQMDPLL